MLRLLTAGESHGKSLTAIVDGVPAGLKIREDDINHELSRRQYSFGRGERLQYIEKDKALERRFQPVLVDEPSVEDTISILRGLKEKYELHHGVRIADAAIVAAATLSDRYISERFLPDKAIDLVDEAAAKLRTEIDSMPEEMDEIDRRIEQRKLQELRFYNGETHEGVFALPNYVRELVIPARLKQPAADLFARMQRP